MSLFLLYFVCFTEARDISLKILSPVGPLEGSPEERVWGQRSPFLSTLGSEPAGQFWLGQCLPGAEVCSSWHTVGITWPWSRLSTQTTCVVSGLSSLQERDLESSEVFHCVT